MIPKIEKGVKIECMACGATIIFSDDTIRVDSDREYIGCPECGAEYDIQSYHIYGTEVQHD